MTTHPSFGALITRLQNANRDGTPSERQALRLSNGG